MSFDIKPVTDEERARVRAHLEKMQDLFHDEGLTMSVNDKSDAERIAELENAIAGIDDDYMTSEKHHPGYVLIPVAVFDRLCAANRMDKNHVRPLP